jgi:hypothetical protein
MEERNRKKENRERQAQGGKGEYRGGRQGQGGIPNPDDADDDASAGSFRRSEDQGTPVDETDDGPQEVAVEKSGDADGDLRNPE